MKAKSGYINKAANYSTLMVKKDDIVQRVSDAVFLFASAVYSEMDKLGIRPSYRVIMQSLCEVSSLTQLEIVKITELKAPTISITLRSMERDGIVVREKNDSDRRETHVSITEKGREMYQQLLGAVAKIQEQMLNDFSEDEKNQLLPMLDKLCDNLR